jgi:hypothetical protein
MLASIDIPSTYTSINEPVIFGILALVIYISQLTNIIPRLLITYVQVGFVFYF